MTEMRKAASIAQILVRVTGLIQIVLGLLIWLRLATALIPVHIVSGLVLVLSLWTLAFVSARSGVNSGLAMFSFAWGIFVVALGLYQAFLLPGAIHWVIQVPHLGVGLATMGLAERLSTGLLGSRRAVGPT